jgi:hypothetical protein
MGLYTQGGSDGELFSLTGSKSFNDGDGVFTIGYAHQNMSMINQSTSATANSTYGKSPNADPNNALPGRSPFEIEHRLFATLSLLIISLGKIAQLLFQFSLKEDQVIR